MNFVRLPFFLISAVTFAAAAFMLPGSFDGKIMRYPGSDIEVKNKNDLVVFPIINAVPKPFFPFHYLQEVWSKKISKKYKKAVNPSQALDWLRSNNYLLPLSKLADITRSNQNIELGEGKTLYSSVKEQFGSKVLAIPLLSEEFYSVDGVKSPGYVGGGILLNVLMQAEMKKLKNSLLHRYVLTIRFIDLDSAKSLRKFKHGSKAFLKRKISYRLRDRFAVSTFINDSVKGLEKSEFLITK